MNSSSVNWWYATAVAFPSCSPVQGSTVSTAQHGWGPRERSSSAAMARAARPARVPRMSAGLELPVSHSGNGAAGGEVCNALERPYGHARPASSQKVVGWWKPPWHGKSLCERGGAAGRSLP